MLCILCPDKNLNSLNKSYSKVLTYEQGGQLPVTAGLGVITGLDNGTHNSGFFCLFGWLLFFLSFLYFLSHSSLDKAKRQTVEIREDLQPDKDGPVLS